MEEHEETENHKSVVIRKSYIYSAVGAVAMVLVFAFAAYSMVANADSVQVSTPTGQAVDQVQGGVQIVKVTMQGSTYMPYPIRLKKGVPARLDIDLSSVQGCYRAVQIPEFSVRKIVNSNDNIIEFTPDRAGTFAFSCYMGMSRGQIVVEDESGSVPSAVVENDIPAGSCGSEGSGGCGCGGDLDG